MNDINEVGGLCLKLHIIGFDEEQNTVYFKMINPLSWPVFIYAFFAGMKESVDDKGFDGMMSELFTKEFWGDAGQAIRLW